LANHTQHIDLEKNKLQSSPSPGKRLIKIGVLPLVLMILMGTGYWLENSKEGRSLLRSLDGAPPDGYTTPLIDSQGKPTSLSSLKGKWVVLLFGFVSCPDICPTHLAYLSKEISRLNREIPAGNPPADPLFQGVFVSVDPKRDTIANLESYRQHFDKGRGDIIALTGSVEDLRKLARSYGGFFEYRKDKTSKETLEETDIQSDSHYDVAHSTGFFIIDPLGNLANVISPPLAQGQLVDMVNQAQRKF
jgi:protein SCO1/2